MGIPLGNQKKLSCQLYSSRNGAPVLLSLTRKDWINPWFIQYRSNTQRQKCGYLALQLMQQITGCLAEGPTALAAP
jgi:hypothetical protein